MKWKYNNIKERKNVTKKILYVILLVCSFLMGCTKKNQENQLIGYWMGPYAGIIAFTDEKHCTYGNEQCTYQVYDGSHIQIISYNGQDVRDMIFKIENGKLYLKSTGIDTYEEYTKDEKEQKEILRRNQEEKDKQELEIQKREQISKIQEEIDRQECSIKDAKNRIITNKQDIQRWKEDIEERKRACKESIAFGDDKEYSENERDDFIAADNEAIKNCEKRISELKKEIEKCEGIIKELKEEINN